MHSDSEEASCALQAGLLTATTVVHVCWWEEAPAHLGVLHKLGEAELQVVAHVQVEQVVGDRLRRRVQEGHQQRHHLARPGHIRRRRHRPVHAACGAMGSDLFVHLRGRLDMLRSDNRAVQSIHVNYKCGQTFILQCLVQLMLSLHATIMSGRQEVCEVMPCTLGCEGFVEP